jgi:hypothetical protein
MDFPCGCSRHAQLELRASWSSGFFYEFPEVVTMESMGSNSKLAKVFLYQNIGFLAIGVLSYLDEFLKLPSLIFSEHPFAFVLRRATLEVLLVLAVWFLVSTSTRRIIERMRYLEKFMRVCAWCHHIDYKGRWVRLEEFLSQGFDTPTTHGICPTCLAEQMATLKRINQPRPKPVESV